MCELIPEALAGVQGEDRQGGGIPGRRNWRQAGKSILRTEFAKLHVEGGWMWRGQCGYSTEDTRGQKPKSRKAGRVRTFRPCKPGQLKCIIDWYCYKIQWKWVTKKLKLKDIQNISPNFITIRFNSHKIILPVTIAVSNCFLSICVLSDGLLITNRHLSTDHTLSSIVHGKPSKGFKHGLGKFRIVFFEDILDIVWGMVLGGSSN